MRLAAWVGEKSIIVVVHALAHAVLDVVVDDVVQLFSGETVMFGKRHINFVNQRFGLLNFEALSLGGSCLFCSRTSMVLLLTMSVA